MLKEEVFMKSGNAEILVPAILDRQGRWRRDAARDGETAQSAGYHIRNRRERKKALCPYSLDACHHLNTKAIARQEEICSFTLEPITHCIVRKKEVSPVA